MNKNKSQQVIVREQETVAMVEIMNGYLRNIFWRLSPFLDNIIGRSFPNSWHKEMIWSLILLDQREVL